MNSVARTKEGTDPSCFTSLERFAPLTLGIATFNLIFIQGVISVAASHDVARTAPGAIKIQVLSAWHSCSRSLGLATSRPGVHGGRDSYRIIREAGNEGPVNWELFELRTLLREQARPV